MDLTPDTSGAGEGLWLSVSQLATRKGRTKQTIAERVARYEERGLITTRPGERGMKLVNVAEYDRVANEVTDLAKEAGAQTKRIGTPEPEAAPDPNAGLYTREQARRMSYQADAAKLDLEERLGRLVPVEDVTAAAVRCSESIVRVIDQIVLRAEDFASAVARDGVTGARTLLKTTAHDLRRRIAEEIAKLVAADAAASDASPSTEDLDDA